MAKSGWYKESARHSLAAKGVPTGRKGRSYTVKMKPQTQTSEELAAEYRKREELGEAFIVNSPQIKPYTLIPMRDLIRKNEESGRYWFSDDTMSFFKSYVGGYAYAKKGDDRTAYFISSEKSPYAPRAWTIRRMDMADGNVLTDEKGTDFEFQKFTTQKSAEKRLMEILKE